MWKKKERTRTTINPLLARSEAAKRFPPEGRRSTIVHRDGFSTRRERAARPPLVLRTR